MFSRDRSINQASPTHVPVMGPEVVPSLSCAPASTLAISREAGAHCRRRGLVAPIFNVRPATGHSTRMSWAHAVAVVAPVTRVMPSYGDHPPCGKRPWAPSPGGLPGSGPHVRLGSHVPGIASCPLRWGPGATSAESTWRGLIFFPSPI